MKTQWSFILFIFIFVCGRIHEISSLRKVTTNSRWSSEKKGYHSYILGKDILGPLEIQWAGMKGRGLFLTDDVEAGEVLIMEKAFCHSFDSDSYNSLDVLVFSLYEKIKNSDQDNALLAYLSNGIRPMVLPKLDDFCNRRVEKVPELSIEEIQGIVKYNSFDFFNNSSTEKSGGREVGSALWLITSFLNHDKESNVYRGQEGQMKIITAARDLKKGTELATMYHSSSEALKQWGIVE
jgi:hypothetical protein